MINSTDDISYLYTEQQRSAAFNAMVKETGWDNPLGLPPILLIIISF